MGGPRFDLTRARALVLHPGARALAPAFVDDLVGAVGDVVHLLPDGSRRVWVRDYCPLIVKGDGGALKQLTFLSPHPGESRFFFEDLDAEVVNLRLIMRGGGVACCGDHVFISRALADQNQVWPREEEARERFRRGHFEPRTLEEVVGAFGDALDIGGAQIRLVAPMPGERTGHLTPVLRPLPDGRVVVPELTEEAFAQISYAHEIGVGRLVQTYLDVKAAELGGLGISVARLPMLPPIDLSRTPERPEGWVGHVHSAAAAALIAVGDIRRAYLPTFDDDAFPAGYRKLKAELLETCKAFYADAGFEPVLVDATAVAREGGSLPRLLGTIPA